MAPPAVVAAVGVGQICQGALPPLLARRLGAPVAVQVIAGLASIAGQDWNAFLGWRGGRGLSHSLGALFALSPEALPPLALLGTAGWAAGRAPLGMIAGLAIAPVLAARRRRPPAVILGCAGVFALALAKRLEANRTPVAAGEPLARTLLRRLLFDRDLPDREAWLGRDRFDRAAERPVD